MLEIDRTLVSTRLAEALERDIAEGVWSERLPGYRILGRHYGVSRATCDAAFAILEERGVLAEAEPRKQRQILSCNLVPTKASHKKEKTMLAIVDRDRPEKLDPLFVEIRKYWLRQFGEFREVAEDLSRYKKPNSRLMRAIKRENADCLLLYVPPSRWIEAAAASGLPFHLLGGDYSEAVHNPSGSGYQVGSNYERILERMSKMGHRRILSPTHLHWRLLRTTMLGTHAKVLGGREADYEEFIVDFPETEPKAWQSYWKKAFLRLRPTAVIVQNANALLSLYGFCYVQGIRIPDELSVVCISSESELEWVHPLPTRMRYPYEKAVRHFQAWARQGFEGVGMKFIDLDWVDGESLAPPGE